MYFSERGDAMKNTILFDLDGTLLPMDFHAFMKVYFGSMGHTFKDTLDPQKMIEFINAATKVTVMTNDGRTNEEIFMTYFNTLIEEDIASYIPRWEAFYDEAFLNCKETTWQDDDMKNAVSILKEKGYRLAIATNPLLPLKSNLHRIRWAGFEPSDFEYISNFEQNKYCKPFLEFYQEVLNDINVLPENCYMVGNDATEDLVAGKLGIETYLITDCMLNHKNVEYHADHEGTYKDFLDFANKLQVVK